MLQLMQHGKKHAKKKSKTTHKLFEISRFSIVEPAPQANEKNSSRNTLSSPTRQSFTYENCIIYPLSLLLLLLLLLTAAEGGPGGGADSGHCGVMSGVITNCKFKKKLK